MNDRPVEVVWVQICAVMSDYGFVVHDVPLPLDTTEPANPESIDIQLVDADRRAASYSTLPSVQVPEGESTEGLQRSQSWHGSPLDTTGT